MAEKRHKALRLHLQIDGSSRGNPGPSASAAVLRDDEGTVLAEVAQQLGTTTNNVAEYFALIMGLEEALKLRAEQVVVECDSELLVRQRRGEYKVRDARLQRLERWVRRLEEGFRSVTYTHIPREANARADALAREALRRRSDEVPPL
jgi:ribonuclease HI